MFISMFQSMNWIIRRNMAKSMMKKVEHWLSDHVGDIQLVCIIEGWMNEGTYTY